MPLAPVVAAALTTPETRTLSLFIGPRDATPDTLWSSVSFTDSGSRGRGLASFHLTKPLIAFLPELKDQVRVRVVAHADGEAEAWTGHVTVRAPKSRPGYSGVDVTATYHDALLDATWITWWPRPSETLAARIGSLWRFVSAHHVSGDLSQVQDFGGPLPAQNFQSLTVREAIELAIAQASPDGAYYLDGGGRIHVFESEVNPAPAQIVDPIAPMGTRTVLADEGAGNHYLAFPDIQRAANSDILVSYNDFNDHADTAHTGQVKMLRSTDEGESWAAAVVIIDAPNPGTVGASGGIHAILANGTLVAVYEERDGNLTLAGRVPHFTTSTDHGATWAAGTEITGHGFSSWVATSAPLIVLPNGDWLFPCYGVSGSDRAAKVLVSTNQGSSWSVRATIVSSDHLLWSEPSLARYDDGELVSLIREDSGTGMYVSRSFDDGATWTPPLLAYAGKAHAVPTILPNGDLLIVSRADPNGGTIFRTSRDRGLAWSPEFELDSSGLRSLYGSALVVDGGALVVWSQENSTSDADILIQTFSSEVAPQELSMTYDADAYANRVHIQGATPAGSGLFQDPAAIAAADGLIRTAVVQAPDSEAATMAQAMANMYLGRVSAARPRGGFVVSSPADGWRSGQNVRILSGPHGIDDTFRVVRVGTRILTPGGDLKRAYSVEFGAAKAGTT